MKKIVYIIYFAIVAILYGCEKQNDSFSSSLIGEWTWLKSFGGIGGVTYTPESTKTNIELVFEIDSVYNKYENDILKNSSSFHTYKIVTKNGLDTVDILEFDETSIQKSFFITHDSLILNDIFMADGYISYYKRRK